MQKGDVKEVTKFDSAVIGSNHYNELKYTAQSNESSVNNSATILAKPNYPAAARAVKVSGVVQVQVTIDEDGEVAAAKAISGHPLLRYTAEKAAKESRFEPTLLSGQPVKITGIIVYNFVP